ncbi:hypothetical protein CR513_57107, partial [Mucuna pruriens]
MTEDKVINLGHNEIQNLVGPSQLDDRNYLQWTQYIRTTFKGRKKLSHIEGNDLPRDDPKLIERERIFKFLHGLNFEYDPIRVQILGKEKLPSLFEEFTTGRMIGVAKKQASNFVSGANFIVAIDVIKTPTLVYVALKDEN